MVIGYEADFAPLTFLDGSECRGLVIDIVSEALERLGMTPVFTPVPLPDQDAAVQSGQIDAVAFKAIISERARAYDFSEPLVVSGAAWFLPAPGASQNWQPADGTRIATPRRGPLYARLRRDHPTTRFPDIATYGEALNAVASGDADGAALNFHMGRYLAARDHPGRFDLPERPFQEIPLGLGCAKDRHREFLAGLNRILMEMKSRAEIGEMERRWL